MTPVTRAMLKQWFVEAPKGSTHMIVAVDEFDWSTYPVYVAEGEDVRKRHQEEHLKPLQRVMEVYRLDYSFDKQVDRHRCVVYALPPDGHDDRVLAVVAAIDDTSLELGRLTAAEAVAICRVERARRLAAVELAAAVQVGQRYEEMKRGARVAAHAPSTPDHPKAETDGEAAGPSPSETTTAEAGPASVEPPAPAASPSPITLAPTTELRAMCTEHGVMANWIVCIHTDEIESARLVDDPQIVGDAVCRPCRLSIDAGMAPTKALRLACGACVRARWPLENAS